MIEQDEVFGASALRLTVRQWCYVATLSLILGVTVPKLWFESLDWTKTEDYRIPYPISKDYALYRQHLSRHANAAELVYVVGDSVVWGEYVAKDGTLSHFLSMHDQRHHYVNAGINGLFPLALEGLFRHYGQPVRGQHVILHCNLLWMSSPEADLSAEKEQVFNHVDLVPQLRVDIPCYRADLTTRVARSIGNRLPHLQWARHLQVVHFDGLSIPDWTLQDDGKYPASYPHAYDNPFARLTVRTPREDELDTQRGPSSPRHQSWIDAGRLPQSFSWMSTDASLQWAAFQRLCELLVSRDNRLFVVIGPFNEHMVQPDNLDGLQVLRRDVMDWLESQQIDYWHPPVLPSDLYGDASHPLTDGYGLLATQLLADPGFQSWLLRP